MAWVYLIVAGGLETLWATTMQLSEGFTKLGYSLLTLGVMAASVLLLAQAMKSLPMGTAYAVWTGIGALGAVIAAAGTALVVVLFIGSLLWVMLEEGPVPAAVASAGRIFFATLLLVGIVGLKATSH